MRVVVPAPGLDPLAWLAERPSGTRRYWRARDGSDASAVWGVADAITADGLDELKDQLSPRLAALPPEARYYGAARFDAGGPVAPEWEAFGRVSFGLPRFEVRSTPEGTVLACHVTPADRADRRALDADLALLAAPLPGGDGRAEGAPPILAGAGATERTDTPDRAEWERSIAHALDAFRAGTLDKVVLARRSVFTATAVPDSMAVPGILKNVAPACYHVVVEAGDTAFVSATPERLFRLAGGRLETEAVAGTRPGDAADTLAADEKDRREHALVVDDLRARLAPLAAALDVAEVPRLLTLRSRVHLRTPIEAQPRAGVGALDLLAALHPTPAVGGTPREAAREAIAVWEGFDRGLYAGPVGWVGRDAEGGEAAEFAVGIRSALLQPGRAALFAGAGIVPGSEAEAEWDEVEGKMSDLGGALGLV